MRLKVGLRDLSERFEISQTGFQKLVQHGAIFYMTAKILWSYNVVGMSVPVSVSPAASVDGKVSVQ